MLSADCAAPRYHRGWCGPELRPRVHKNRYNVNKSHWSPVLPAPAPAPAIIAPHNRSNFCIDTLENSFLFSDERWECGASAQAECDQAHVPQAEQGPPEPHRHRSRQRQQHSATYLLFTHHYHIMSNSIHTVISMYLPQFISTCFSLSN